MKRWLLPVLALATAPLLTAMVVPPVAVSGPPGPAQAGPAAAPHSVPVHQRGGHAAKVPAMPVWHPSPTSWPAAGTKTVTLATGSPAATQKPAAALTPAQLAGPSSGSVSAGQLPLHIGPAATAGRRQAPARVTVSIGSHQAAGTLGIHGVVFALAQPAAATSATSGTSGPADTHVSLEYSSFADAYGGDYASRLRLVELPACALTTPKRPACRAQTPLRSANDVRTDQLGADVSLPAASAQQPTMVLAATAGTSGSSGDYTATPLSEAGSWAQAGSSGAFTYSYPIQVPPVPGGLEPDVALAYSSQTVDGLTSSTNSQASWIGDGWNYSPGYVQRDYQSCEVNSGSQKTGDFCWSSNDTVTLQLNGTNTTLVHDDSTGAWHPESDTGVRVSYATGTTNGTYDGGYWVITTTDGTQYYFGLNQLPGYASGDQATNSAWTMPVYATSSSQPCYNATWTSSYCSQAWRWNLDYVVDPHQDAIAYYYGTETNSYSSDNGTTANRSYVQAGGLTKIQYGLRAGSVYGTTPAAQVNFSTGTARTDVPADLSCTSGSACNVVSPTFWGKYQLTGISTQTLEGSSLASVDSWSLAQTYPSTGDSTTPAALWLSSITRTGQDGTAVSLPPVSFTGTGLPNRVETTADMNDGYSILTRFRMHTITEETGGTVTVAYDTAGGACTSGNFPAPDANTALCYPDWWTPPTTASPIEDWFNKYVVQTITQQDTDGGGVPVQTAYSYAGAAWHYNDDTLTRSQQRTWDQWRGFRTVTTETGTSPDPVTETQDTYLQGMDGDYQSNGSTSSVSVTSSRSDSVTDSDDLAGLNLEHIAYNGAGAGEVSDTITLPWLSGATATQSQPSPLPPLKSYLSGVAEAKTYTALAGGGYREGTTTYTHDSYGRVTSESSVPQVGDDTQDTCTTTSYASSTSAWILNLPSEVQVTSVPCGTSAVLPTDAVSDLLSFYDGATSLSSDTPTAGDVTETQKTTSYNGTTPVYTTQTTSTFDEYGRVLTAADADNRTTKTAYTPATGAEPTSVAVTDPMNLVTTTSYDAARDLPVKVTNPANYVTTETYDALGRLTSVWLPGHPQGTDPANYTFSYAVSNTAPSVVTTNTVNDTGSYATSKTLYDSLGRQAETQSTTPDGGRDVSDIYYNSDGWQQLTSDPYYNNASTPNGTLVAAPDSQVPSQTGYVYDGDGRVTKQISYKFATETWETDTTYGGNYTTVVPPQGGTSQTTFTDGRGLTTAIDQYHSGVPADPSDPASDYDKTSYTYTPAQQLATIGDSAGNQWSYQYDLLGDQKTQTDPDSGTTSSQYDAAGQLMQVTDARSKQISYSYDADGRKTGKYDTTGGAGEAQSDEIAAWAYDTIKKGLPTSSTAYYQGAAFTQQVMGYNVYGTSEGTKTTVPSTAQTASLAGTYETQYGYDSDTGNLSSYYDTAGGGLPAETVNLGYDTQNDPVSVTSTIGDYVSSLSYTPLNQPQEYTLGTTNAPVQIDDYYDQQTRRITGQDTVTGTSKTTVDDTQYNYNKVGDVTSEVDTPSGGPAQVQCFQYQDYLGRLTQAWSQASNDCSNGPSQPAESGAAAPYWETYSYNAQNDLTGETSTPASGAATTMTNGYPPAGSAQPHAVSSEQISTPSGTTSSGYSYNADGDLTSVTGSSQSESMNWNDAGQLSSVTTTPSAGQAETTSYVYDASGNLLLQQDPSSVTLYLGDEQLVLNTTAGTVAGTRYYSMGSTPIAARTSTGQVSYLVGDEQGTSLVSIDASSLAVTRRYYDPYGNQIGSPPPAWPGARGFVGGTADPSTGLTNLGAREYSPTADSFISPDAIINPGDPQDLNAYAYASDNPSTLEDPTGNMFTQSTGPPRTCTGSSACDGRLGHGASSSPSDDSSGDGPGNYSGGPIPGFGDYPSPASPSYVRSAEGSHAALPVQALMPGPKPTRKVQTNSSSGSDSCTVADMRFGLSPSCRVSARTGSSGHHSNVIDWLGHQIQHHWRTDLEVVGIGVCVFASAGACLGAGVIYSFVNYGASIADTHSLTQGLPALALNLGTTVLTGYAAKVMGGVLTSSGADDIDKAFSLTRGWRDLPYFDKGDIGSRAIPGFDYVSTAHALGNNAMHAAIQCYSSFSSPCS